MLISPVNHHHNYRFWIDTTILTIAPFDLIAINYNVPKHEPNT